MKGGRRSTPDVFTPPAPPGRTLRGVVRCPGCGDAASEWAATCAGCGAGLDDAVAIAGYADVQIEGRGKPRVLVAVGAVVAGVAVGVAAAVLVRARDGSAEQGAPSFPVTAVPATADGVADGAADQSAQRGIVAYAEQFRGLRLVDLDTRTSSVIELPAEG